MGNIDVLNYLLYRNSTDYNATAHLGKEPGQFTTPQTPQLFYIMGRDELWDTNIIVWIIQQGYYSFIQKGHSGADKFDLKVRFPVGRQ